MIQGHQSKARTRLIISDLINANWHHILHHFQIIAN